MNSSDRTARDDASTFRDIESKTNVKTPEPHRHGIVPSASKQLGCFRWQVLVEFQRRHQEEPDGDNDTTRSRARSAAYAIVAYTNYQTPYLSGQSGEFMMFQITTRVLQTINKSRVSGLVSCQLQHAWCGFSSC